MFERFTPSDAHDGTVQTAMTSPKRLGSVQTNAQPKLTVSAPGFDVEVSSFRTQVVGQQIEGLDEMPARDVGSDRRQHFTIDFDNTWPDVRSQSNFYVMKEIRGV